MKKFLEALRTVQRYDAAQWAQLSLATRWAVATRASVLLMTLISALIGGLLAFEHPQFTTSLWLLALFGLLFAHATNNLLNDYVDFVRGVDRGDYARAQYGTHVLHSGLLSRNAMLAYIAASGALALACGAALLWLRGGMTLPLLLAGVFFVLFYTWPLKYLGLGEPAVLLVWGPLMCGGAYYSACGEWSWVAALIGTVYGIGPTIVLFGKHIDKFEADRARGIRTLPVLLGLQRARLAVLTMIVAQYLLIAILVLSLQAPWPLLLCLLNIAAARRALVLFSSAAPAQRPAAFPEALWPLWYAHHGFVLNRRFAVLLLAGLVLALLL